MSVDERRTAADGIVIVDKPAGWTSHDVVGRMRRLAATRKVGHAGTLDPMATGVLVVGIGRATKLLTYIVGQDKEYRATIRLGQGTTTDDADGETITEYGAEGCRAEQLEAAIAMLTGEIRQVPATVSAIKVNGQRAYARVRAGEQVTLADRPVTVGCFEIVAPPRRVATLVDVDVRVVCSAGTYVRALARDLGAILGTGGHLTALRRTRVGGYAVDAARSLEDLGAQVDAAGQLSTLGMAQAVHSILEVRQITAAQATALSYGQWIESSGRAGTVAALDPCGDLIALVVDTPRHGVMYAKPVLVFSPA